MTVTKIESLLKKRGRLDAQPARQFEQRFHANVALAALDPADIVWVEAGAVGEFLLGQVERLPEAAGLAAQGQQVGIVPSRRGANQLGRLLRSATPINCRIASGLEGLGLGWSAIQASRSACISG
jgi:hypothetical protein